MFANFTTAIVAVFNFVPTDVWLILIGIGTVCSVLTGNGLFLFLKFTCCLFFFYGALVVADFLFSPLLEHIAFFIIASAIVIIVLRN